MSGDHYFQRPKRRRFGRLDSMGCSLPAMFATRPRSSRSTRIEPWPPGCTNSTHRSAGRTSSPRCPAYEIRANLQSATCPLALTRGQRAERPGQLHRRQRQRRVVEQHVRRGPGRGRRRVVRVPAGEATGDHREPVSERDAVQRDLAGGELADALLRAVRARVPGGGGDLVGEAARVGPRPHPAARVVRLGADQLGPHLEPRLEPDHAPAQVGCERPPADHVLSLLLPLGRAEREPVEQRGEAHARP